MRVTLRVNILIIVALLFSSASAQPSTCDGAAAAAKELMAGPRQSRYEYRGRYVNLAYYFSVRIPRGLTAYDGRDQPRHNGFVLPLAQESVIFVSGDPNSLEYKTPREAAKGDVDFLRQPGRVIESEKITEARLGTLNAAILLVTYTCQGSAERHVRSSLSALSANKEFLYQLELNSTANRYESDHAVMDQLIKSWMIRSRSTRQR